MFIFNHKSTILDVSQYDCLAFVNPENNENDFDISKIHVDTDYPVDFSILNAPANFDGYKENDITDQIKSNVIGKTIQTNAKLYGHPDAKATEVLKEVLVDEPAILIEEDDGYVLKPGNALIFRANAKAPNTIVHIVVHYMENQ